MLFRLKYTVLINCAAMFTEVDCRKNKYILSLKFSIIQFMQYEFRCFLIRVSSYLRSHCIGCSVTSFWRLTDRPSRNVRGRYGPAAGKSLWPGLGVMHSTLYENRRPAFGSHDVRYFLNFRLNRPSHVTDRSRSVYTGFRACRK